MRSIPHQEVTDTTAPNIGWLRRTGLALKPRDLVGLAEVWALILVLWIAKLVFNLDNSAAVFGVILFALIAAPKAPATTLNPTALDDPRRLVAHVLAAYAVASIAALVVGESVTSFRTLLFIAAGAIVMLFLARVVGYKAERMMRMRRPLRTVVIGGGVIAQRVVSTIERHQEYGLRVVGALDDNPRFGADELGTRVLGPTDDLGTWIDEHGVQAVIVAYSATDQAALIPRLRDAQEKGVTVWIVPRFFEIATSSPEREELWGLPVVRLNTPADQRPEWALKRAFDIVISAAGLLLLAPVMALAALAILIESGRPVFYFQERVGRGGKSFRIAKFRSMTETDGDDEWCDESEQRVTKVGRVIRALGVDELPQFINVLRGHMSLVGPRPERPLFANRFAERYATYSDRHRVSGGVTGASQIRGLRGDTSIEERAQFDNLYIENWTFAEDLKIVLRTPAALLKQAAENRLIVLEQQANEQQVEETG